MDIRKLKAVRVEHNISAVAGILRKVDEAKEMSTLDNERTWNIGGIHFETENSAEWADIEEEFTVSDD